VAEETEDGPPVRRTRASPRNGTLRLLRYQLLTPDGKLFEYRVATEGPPRLDEDISAISLFEFLPDSQADRDSLGPDTLRIGRKVVPCVVKRFRRYGSEEWTDDDTSFVNRARMTRTFWRNPGIPVTGYAKSILEVASERVRVGSGAGAAPESAAVHAADSTVSHAADSAASPEILGTPAASGGESPAGGRLFYRAEVTLLDLGTGAVPEVTQEPEPAPAQTPPPDLEEAAPPKPGRLIE
jgi:hypothetical protein